MQNGKLLVVVQLLVVVVVMVLVCCSCGSENLTGKEEKYTSYAPNCKKYVARI